MSLAGVRAFNRQFKQYFADVAGIEEIAFNNLLSEFDDTPRNFDQGLDARSWNDTVRVGLEALGYGAVLNNFDSEPDPFDAIEGNFGGSNALNSMLRRWAIDQLAGALSEHFEDIGDTFDTLRLQFPRAVHSLNTALREALNVAITPDDAFDLIADLFNEFHQSFDASSPAIESIDETMGRYTFGSPVLSDFEGIAEFFENIGAEFGGDNDTAVLTTFDAEQRHYDAIN